MLPIPFANPATYRGHSGVDWPQPRGTVFRASGPGRVTNLGYGLRAGHTVWVQYDSGPLVMYAHLDRRSSHVTVGQRVSEGTPLGVVGSLGLNSTGPHLHAEVSGHSTTAGFWRFFTPSRVVGVGGGSGSPTPTRPAPVPVTSEEDDMKHLYISDSVDGNDVPGWALLNVRTGKVIPLREDAPNAQAHANGWARVWGDARSATRQDMLNAIAAIQGTA